MSGKTVKHWKERSAKVQVRESDLPSSIPPQTGLSFNLWYNKWSQGHSGNARFVNPYRLEPNLHSGVSRGDLEGNKFFCLYFAKGLCCLGKKCTYKHHIPEEEDTIQLNLKTGVLDCFGREKFGEFRDDMGGVGSFRKQNKTLYIGGLTGSLNNKNLSNSQIESRLRFMFGRLGEIERIRYVESKNCAFVSFRFQCNAEFAKEAMSNQTLLIPSDKEWDARKEGTGLLVKWANDDPDPKAKKRMQQESEKEAVNVMKKLLEKHDQNQNQDNNEAENNKRKNTEEESSIFSEGMLSKFKKRRQVIEKETDKCITLNTNSDSTTTSAVPVKSPLVSLQGYESSSDEE
ncbi:hypothetical protein Kpol_1031p63 [Vanderwaltozyma polyspora DSM 70294]|uniref:Pre-mRNA-splicing factor CWC2 n=1 Tax=Vanderwaltozyma polyspora (strain ATCC 22028 / DSM 70294 / BCRC 21397 / CBS 2163 / NBRC 10782 / NRRL Y-8283 / UCD 57-17) TaxID=436907 RepID=A7THZ4_VANPO|nr:uncharacterized protein Kpol_1031p63 [Vanderwaltozyma polyspora DSM 70294]EDO18156.1 hypothetical protein Kpol_1031p63 [Vanderwaltozyma polyspora DSM 70294]